MADIDIDVKMLESMVGALSAFQQVITDRFSALEREYMDFEATFQGQDSQEFKKAFDETKSAVAAGLQIGDEALHWLETYLEIVRDF